MQRFTRLLAVLFALTISSPGGSGGPAGTAVAVVPQADGTLDGNSAVMATGDGVFLGQNVITGNAGQVQIVFSDNTHLVIGPQASLVISEYLMRNDGSASKFVVDALSGSFRFMTGNSPKNAYRIKTPTGTLGVRGTAFDFTVEPGSGKTTVLLYHGGVRMCGASGCTELSESCAVGVLAKRAAAAVVRPHDKRRPQLLKNFPYLASQQPLKAAFRVKQAGPCKDPAISLVGKQSKFTPDPSEPSTQPPASGPSASEPSSVQPSREPPSREPPSSEPSSSRPPSSEPSASQPSSSPPSSSEPSLPPSSSKPPKSGHDNNGLGNGGDTTSEGDSETGNQGAGKGSGHGNGGVGNGNGNGSAKH